MDDSLLNRLRQVAAPTPELDHPPVEAGQLWRAYWRVGDIEVACLVVITKAAPLGVRNVDVVAVSEPTIGDDNTTVVETVNGFKVAAWTGTDRTIYKFTLDHRIGDLTSESFAKVRAVQVGELRGDCPPIYDVLDDRSLERADLLDRLDALAAADWTPSNDEVNTDQSVDDLARAAGVTNADIAKQLGITPGEAQRLRTGLRQVRQEEVDVLTRLLGASPMNRISVDEEVVAHLDEPELRPRLRMRADQKHGGDEVAARRRVAEMAMATSFRQQVPGPTNWKQAILQVLDEG
jgi:hypothetical protein